MNNDFKKIAKGLGLILPACLLSIEVANAATINKQNNNEQNVCIKLDRGNDVINHLIINETEEWSNIFSPDHTDTHTDLGGNHSDSHSDYAHQDKHTNKNASTQTKKVRNEDGTYSSLSYCSPHTNNHTNRDGYNRHTNSGNKSHTDTHTDRNSTYDCN